MPRTDSSDKEEQLESSLNQLEALLGNTTSKNTREPLDASRLNEVITKMEADSQELRSLVDEGKSRIVAAREAAVRNDRFWKRLKLGFYLLPLVGIIVHFIIFGR